MIYKQFQRIHYTVNTAKTSLHNLQNGSLYLVMSFGKFLQLRRKSIFIFSDLFLRQFRRKYEIKIWNFELKKYLKTILKEFSRKILKGNFIRILTAAITVFQTLQSSWILQTAHVFFDHCDHWLYLLNMLITPTGCLFF